MCEAGTPPGFCNYRKMFQAPPHYGKELSWPGSTVFDTASLLLRYLKSLREPSIPYAPNMDGGTIASGNAVAFFPQGLGFFSYHMIDMLTVSAS